MTPIALSVAGSDPSGGAGIQADLKTFCAHRVFGMAAISLLTVQNTCGVRRSVPVAADLLQEQVTAVLDDAMPHAIKTGALGGRPQVEALADALDRADALGVAFVIDPVCVSKSGAALLDEAGRGSLIARLLPRATLVTPNLDEAELLLGRSVRSKQEIVAAGMAFIELGAQAALIKGGHRDGDPIDVLCTSQGSVELAARRIQTPHTHGVGCSLSAAISARLARGETLEVACRTAKSWLSEAISAAPGIGRGQGAVDHLVSAPEPEDHAR